MCRERALIAVLLLFTGTEALTIPSKRAIFLSRGGGEDSDLDAYINELIAGVSDPEQEDRMLQEVAITETAEDAITETAEDAGDVMAKVDVQVEDDGNSVAVTAAIVTEPDEDEEEEEDARPLSVPTRRPNALYRFLLNHGPIGHAFVMLFVWIGAFITTYIPPLANFVSMIHTAIFGVAPLEYSSQRSVNDKGKSTTVNEQYAAFADTRSMRGKARKTASLKADQDAAAQLRRLGSVDQARYRLLSVDFMKKHELGPYASETVRVDGGEAIHVTSVTGDDEEDDDVDWVVEALTKENDDEEKEKPPPSSTKRSKHGVSFEPSLGISNTGVTVGIRIGSRSSPSSFAPHKKKRTKTLIQAATSNAERTTKKVTGPRVSDREGGMLGRLRDFSANNLVSRSLLGAYPGDAPPPSQAASANGIIELAQKYGYGDWSDDEDNELLSASTSKRKKRRKVASSGPSSSSSRSSSNKRRQRSRDSAASNVSMEFSVNSSSRKKPSVSPRRSVLDSSRINDKRVRLPMERLKEKDDSLQSD